MHTSKWLIDLSCVTLIWSIFGDQPINSFESLYVKFGKNAIVFFLFLFPVSECKNIFLLTISDQSTYCVACYIWRSIIKTQSTIIIDRREYFKESISDQSTKPFQFERGKKQTNYAPIKWSQDTACPWKFIFIADLK